jgi:hypothetical protein
VNYTKQEKGTIDLAYSSLRYIVECSHRAEQWLEEAYKYERKGRSSTFVTKAILVECFLDGWFAEKITPGDLFSYSEGCGKLVMIGAYFRKQYPERANEDNLALLRDAVATQRDYSHRRIEALNLA